MKQFMIFGHVIFKIHDIGPWNCNKSINVSMVNVSRKTSFYSELLVPLRWVAILEKNNSN